MELRHGYFSYAYIMTDDCIMQTAFESHMHPLLSSAVIETRLAYTSPLEGSRSKACIVSVAGVVSLASTCSQAYLTNGPDRIKYYT